jgi:hypothetical protein
LNVFEFIFNVFMVYFNVFQYTSMRLKVFE